MEYLRYQKSVSSTAQSKQRYNPSIQIKDNRNAAIVQEKQIKEIRHSERGSVSQLAGLGNRFGHPSFFGAIPSMLGYGARSLAYYAPRSLGGGAVAYNPVGRSAEQLWLDASPNTILPQEAPGTTPARVLAATGQLVNLGMQGGVIAAMLAVNEADSPRNVGLPAAEDGLSRGHTDDRHVLNAAGTIGTIDQLALRAVGRVPAAPCPGKASAFFTAGDGQSAIQSALTTHWYTFWRNKIAGRIPLAGVQEIIHGVSAHGMILRNFTGATPLPVAMLPPYAHGAGRGVRPMYPGDDIKTKMLPYLVGGNYVVGGVNLGNKLDEANPLTEKVPVTGVEIRALADNGNGGFTIHSAWPA